MSEHKGPLWADLTAASSREEVLAAVEEYEAGEREFLEALEKGGVTGCPAHVMSDEEREWYGLGEPDPA